MRKASVLVGMLVCLVLGVAGCDAGGIDSSTERSGTRPSPSVTEEAGEATTPPTRAPRTTAEPPTSVEPPTTAEPTTTAEPPTTAEPTTTAEPPTSLEPPTSVEPTTTITTEPTAESGGLGTWGWVLLALLAVAVIAGVLIWRSRSKSAAWDAEAAALEEDTRGATGTQLPPVLTAETAGQRALSWPPLRAALVDLAGRWGLLAGRAPDDDRRIRSGQFRNLLQELVAAVDAENDALATGRDWRLLRPRVDEAGRALSALLAGVPRGEPGQPPPDQWQPPTDQWPPPDDRR
jgi:hypothetical protein